MQEADRLFSAPLFFQALTQDPVTGDYYALQPGKSSLTAPLDDNARASGSRPASPAPPPQASPQLGQTQAQFSQNNPYLQHSSGAPVSASPNMGSSNSSFQRTSIEDRNPYNRLPNPYGSGSVDGDGAGAGIGHQRTSSSGHGAAHLSNSISSNPGRASPSSLAHRGGPRPLPIHTNPISPIATRPVIESERQPEMVRSASPISDNRGSATPNLMKDDDGDSIILTPTQPSEKALGKRRQISDRGDAFDPNIQALALGDQLQQTQIQPTIVEGQAAQIPSAPLQNQHQNQYSNVDSHLNELRNRPPPQAPVNRNQTNPFLV